MIMKFTAVGNSKQKEILLKKHIINRRMKTSIRCPTSHPILVRNKDKRFGDICRKVDYPDNMDWACPKKCIKTSDKNAPFCQMSQESNLNCRIPGGSFVATIIYQGKLSVKSFFLS